MADPSFYGYAYDSPFLRLNQPTEPNPRIKVNRARASSATLRVFSCKYCPRKFCSSHALGGHQNAHRRERAAQARRTMPPIHGDAHHPDDLVRPQPPQQPATRFFTPLAFHGDELVPLSSSPLGAEQQEQSNVDLTLRL